MQSQPTPSSTEIHPSAIVNSGAQIGAGCYIGPYVTIGDDVTLGRGVRIDSHCVIDGRTSIGADTHVYPFVSIGLPPQDLKFAGEQTETEIGQRTRIREFVTIHRGTKGGGGLTKIGDDCFLMAQTHIAHDCIIGNNVIMANAATLAGHVIVHDGANIGAYSGVHQFCRIGREAYVGGYSVVVKDALPFALTVGNHAKCYGLNKVGVRRRGYSNETIAALHHAYHLLLAAKLNTSQAVERMRSEIKDVAEVDELIKFIESSQRGVVK
jgi:UDP-N-acetylglucosamine acyltransferase